LSRLDIIKLEKELATLAKEIEELKSILASEKKLIQVITAELNEIKKKYAEERRTEIQGEIEEIKIDIAMQINAEDCIVTLTNEGYIKRTSPRSFKSMGGTIETCGVKDGDRVRHFVETNTSHTALFFTQDGKYFATLVNSFPDDKWKDIGSAVVNVIPLEKTQRIVGFTIVEDFKQPLYVYHVSRSGLIKKTALADYETNRSSALVAAKLKSADDEFITVFVSGEQGALLGATRDGMGIRFLAEEVGATGRASSGVKAITLAKEDELISFMPVGAEDERVFSLITADGVVKRTKIADIPLQGRAGKGVQLIRKRKTSPHQLLAISVDETMYALTKQNEWQPVPVDQVSINEQGGIGRTVIEGGIESIAYETVLPTDEPKESNATDTASGKKPEEQISLFSDESGEKKG